MSLLDINAWETAKKKMAKYEITYSLFSDRVKLTNKEGVLLGHFYNAQEIINYIYGYESGVLDSRIYKDRKDEQVSSKQ